MRSWLQWAASPFHIKTIEEEYASWVLFLMW
jgi:hypothetical protein